MQWWRRSKDKLWSRPPMSGYATTEFTCTAAVSTAAELLVPVARALKLRAGYRPIYFEATRNAI
jgi:hypothetical protein